MSRQEILNVIDKWISEGSGWVIDRTDNHYINVTTYKPLNGSSYIELPIELQNPAKGLINIKNKDDECFRWCHRHLNPQKTNPQRIKRVDRQFIGELNCKGIEFQYHKNSATKLRNRTASAKINRALKGHAKSLWDIELQDNLDPLNHFTKTKVLVESHLEDLLKTMKRFKFIETLEVTFEQKTIDSKTGKRVSIYKTAFFNGKA